MEQRIFVKVVGFSDVERHALNTVFRLSESRNVAYQLWTGEMPAKPSLTLVDSQAYEGRVEAEVAMHSGHKFIWLGESAPEQAWRSFDRPIAWPEVVNAMDVLFVPPEPLDFDLEEAESQPAPLVEAATPSEPSLKRALIASADRDERLYMRAKLALADLTIADEAETGAQALELMRNHAYQVALVDFSLPDVEGWSFLKKLSASTPAIPHLIVTKATASMPERFRAWLSGAEAFMVKPPHPGKLQDLLEKV